MVLRPFCRVSFKWDTVEKGIAFLFSLESAKKKEAKKKTGN